MSNLSEQKTSRSSPALLAVAVTLFGAALFALFFWPRDQTPRGGAPPDYTDIPRIDVHTHVMNMAEETVELLAQHHIVLSLNASGGIPGQGLEESMAAARRTGGRLLPYCNVPLRGAGTPGWQEAIRAMVAECKRQGAAGLKLFKSLGLGALNPEGELLEADDPRIDVLFDEAARHQLPVLIHTGDPQAFFTPPTPDNERYAELSAHPGWSFYGESPTGEPWPSWEELFGQFERRVARSRATMFLGAHFGNVPEEPDRVSEMLDRYPNLYVETGARIPEIGRFDAERMRAIFERHPTRILFGTDFTMTPSAVILGSSGEEPNSLDEVPGFFASHWRYFETRDVGFAHPTPIQGDWTIDGIGLSRELLERVYWKNAAALFHLELPASEPAAESPRAP